MQAKSSYILYYSVATTALGSEAEVSTMELCIPRNKSLGITGCLLRSCNHYVQYIEGPDENISFIWKRIQENALHDNVKIISKGPMIERKFPRWYMNYIILSEADEINGILKKPQIDMDFGKYLISKMQNLAEKRLNI